MGAGTDPTAGWPCPVHGEQARGACARCGAFVCARCGPGARCDACEAARAKRERARRRAAGFRRTVALSLFFAAVLYALPPLLADAQMLRRGYESNPSMYAFALLLAGPPLLASVLVATLGRLWLATLALPTTVLSLALVLAQRNALGRAYALASLFVLFALIRAVQGWWAGRKT